MKIALHLKEAGVIILGLALFIGLIFYEVAVWRECLIDHSFWYCLRILGR